MAPLAGLDALARGVREAGIQAVTGDVLVDDRLFKPAPSTGSGPRQLAPIVVNDNLIDVVITPDARTGDPAGVAIVPTTAFVSFDAQIETAPEGTEPRSGSSRSARAGSTVRDRLPVGCAPAVKTYEVEEPAAFARAVFIECLWRRGVRVSASPLGRNASGALPSRDEVARLPKVAEYTSPPSASTSR